MKRRFLGVTGFVCGILLLAAAVVSAHDFWLVPTQFRVKPGAKVAVALNTGDTFPASEGAVKPERLESVSLIYPRGIIPLTTFRTEGKSTIVDATMPKAAGGAIVEVVIKPIATKQSRASFDEFVKHEGLDQIAAQLAVEEERRLEERRTYAKYAKTLIRVGSGKGAVDLYKKPLNHRLEIIPDADPYSLKPGEPFPVRLLFDGKPLVNARLVVGSANAATATQSEMPGVRTDLLGRARLQLDKTGGAHYIHALYMIEAADKTNVEWESFWATLTFEARR